ncbi:non-hydrolyzing UDP-N-acetylglucosamine 2-epimerase [Methanochimaera problematica]|nr:UDP-N-acetylglucosamine 2-epimerase (non-hydrolyzing) [Methanoplanus sp. FWC-SCC4]
MISIILGTRPEIIKMSPIIRECQKRNITFNIIHSGQHYSKNMDSVFFEQLELPAPDYNIHVGSGTQAEQTGNALIGIERILLEKRPDIVLVQGDTNTVLAGAIAASKLNIKIGHVEAGLRSYFREMPEEINRVLTDHCSDYLFAPTEKSRNILLKEGISDKNIFVTGNTVVDAVYQNLELSKKKISILKDYNLKKSGYILATVHRKENVDNPVIFRNILNSFLRISNEFNIPVIYPIHPRAKKMMEMLDCNLSGIIFTEPLDYLSFLQLEQNAKIILTDSGGLQEEACIMKVPCVTLRDNTERPETVDVGANILSGTLSESIFKSVEKMMSIKAEWINPFGDGSSSKKILDILNKDQLL